MARTISRIHFAGIAVLFASLSYACAENAQDGATGEADMVASASAPIQWGQLETGYPAVGYVDLGAHLCTGTLISPSIVLTAEHCRSANPVFRTGTGWSDFVAHAVDQQYVHPSKDLRLLHLATPISNIAPLQLNRGALPSVGKTCWGVGFGDYTTVSGTTTNTTNGTKRSCISDVESANADDILVKKGNSIFTGGIADSGDSGGPLLCDSVIAAVVRAHNDGTYPNHVREVYTTIDLEWIDKVVTVVSDQGLPSAGTGWRVYGTGDFNNDGRDDLVLRRTDDTGEPRIWFYNGGTSITDVGLPVADAGWRIYGVGDFNNDGRADLVWRRADDTGEPRIWFYNGGTSITDVGLPVADAGWRIYGVGDFNNDGRSDLVWRRTNDTAEARIWLYNGGTSVTDVVLRAADAGWRIYGVGDFNNDGRSDLVWRRTNDTAEARIWLYNGGTSVTDVGLPSADDDWRINGVADFNGDGTSDLVWRRTNDTSEARIWLIENALKVTDAPLPSNPSGWHIIGTGDFQNNGSSGLLWRRTDESAELRIWDLSSWF